jgi:hypothetical protein
MPVTICTLTGMIKPDPMLAQIAAQFTRYDVEKSGGGYMILDRTSNPVARLQPIPGTDRFELFFLVKRQRSLDNLRQHGPHEAHARECP